MKERLKLENLLPIPNGQNAGEILFQALAYLIDWSEDRSKLALKQYADYHREYPNFVRISI
jgi:hypothetical protein